MQPLALAESGGANGKKNRRKMLCLCRRFTPKAGYRQSKHLFDLLFLKCAGGEAPSDLD